MTRMKYLVAAATLSLALVGCSGSNEQVPDNPPNEIYATAQQKLQDGNWKQAITQLEALDNRYPFGPYSQQVQLDLIYAYYKNADIDFEWHYIDISDADWAKNMEARNAAVAAGETTDYAVDSGLLQKILTLFETPIPDEIDVWFTNRR